MTRKESGENVIKALSECRDLLSNTWDTYSLPLAEFELNELYNALATVNDTLEYFTRKEAKYDDGGVFMC